MLSLSLLPYTIAALAALVAAALALWVARGAHLRAAWPLALAALSALAAVAGLAWRGWLIDAWPGATLPDGLALFAFGALVTFVSVQLLARRQSIAHGPDAAWAALLAATGVILAAAAVLAALLPAGVSPARGRAWLYGVTGVVAGIGVGGLLAVLSASAVWVVRTLRVSERPTSPPGLGQPYLPATDQGRLPALFTYPWLTAALVLAGFWNLSAHAAPLRGVPGELWLLASWLLCTAYLHITSGWRPLRLPAWLPPIVAAGAAAAGLLAALTLSSLLVE